MTTVITRVFQDEASANSAAEQIVFKGIPSRQVQVIPGGNVENLMARMEKAKVHESAQEAYAKCVEQGQSILVVRATYKPLGAARITREVLAKRETVEVTAVVDDYYMPDGPEKARSVLKEHPHFLTMRIGRKGGYQGGPVSVGMGLKLLSPRKARTSAVRQDRRASRAFWPMPLLSTKERSNKVMSGGRFMSKAFWPMPLLSTKERKKSVIPGGGTVFSKTVDWPTN